MRCPPAPGRRFRVQKAPPPARGRRDAAASGDLGELAAGTLARARDHLLGLQDPRGWWIGELETNVTMDAEDLLLRHFLGILTETDLKETAAWIRSQQRDDGTWANFYGGPGDLSTTVEAYVALRLAGDPVDAEHMKTASGWITGKGGLTATRVFTRMWLALSGLWDWNALPVIPPEVIYLPSWFPLNIYDWGCWARQTIVALAVVSSFKPSNPVTFTVEELHAAVPGLPPKGDQKDPWSLAFNALDKALHKVEPRIPARARRAARRRCTDWIIARQEADGCWGGIQPPWVYSIMALRLMGYGLDNPLIKKALDGLEGFTIRENGMRRLEACQSPVWDTVLAMIALEDAGLEPANDALVHAANWILDEEIRQPGDWQVRRPHTAPGGWAFEFENDNYADTDDTAEVVLALRRTATHSNGSRCAAAPGSPQRCRRCRRSCRCRTRTPSRRGRCAGGGPASRRAGGSPRAAPSWRCEVSAGWSGSRPASASATMRQHGVPDRGLARLKAAHAVLPDGEAARARRSPS